MNKNDIYDLIGYDGVYNTSVKKALRKLLKENHPDNKGDRKKFELINEVKEELENGKASYSKNIDNNTFKEKKDVDYDYCYKRINEIKTSKSKLSELLQNKKQKLNTYEQEYKSLYDSSLNLENNLLINFPHIKKVENIKLISMAFLIIMVIVFIISILKNSQIFFTVFIVLSIIFIFIFQRYLYMMSKIGQKNKKKITSYVKINNSIRKNVAMQDEIKTEIRNIKKELTRMENDIRFYKNMLK